VLALVIMRWVVLAVVLVVVSVTGRAQEPVFRAGVDLVTVDAIVVDKDGRPVTGLTADDFLLTVDGKPRNIDAVELVSVRPSDAPADLRLPDVSSNDVSEPGRLLILVVDRNNIRVGDGRVALDGLRDLVSGLSPRDRLGLVTLPGGGPIVQPTSDHRAVLEALTRVRGMETQQLDPLMKLTISEALRIDRNVPGTLTKVVERNCIGGGQAAPEDIADDPVSGKLSQYSLCKIRVQTAAGRLVREIRASNSEVIASLDALLEGLRDVDARKTIVYVSQGLVFDQQMQGQLRAFGSRVAAASATFYAIQMNAPGVSSIDGGMVPDFQEDQDIRADGLYYLAGVTGGALFRPGAGLGVTAARIARETSARYALGFQVQSGERDGKRHDIKVALRRERGLTIRHRTEFTAEVRPKRFTHAPETLGAALSQPTLLAAVPLRVAPTLVPDGSNQPKVLLAAAVGANALSGRYARTRLAYEIFDADGRRYGQTEEVDAVTPVYSVALRMWPGRYRIKVAVKDAEGRLGSLEHPFEVTAPPDDALHVGGAMLFRDTGETTTPALLVDAPAGERAIGVHVFVHAPTPAAMDGVGGAIEVTHVDEQATRFTGPMALTCDKVGTGCELDTTLPSSRWPAGRYRADATISKSGAPVAHTIRTFDLIAIASEAPPLTDGGSASPSAPRSAVLDGVLSRATAYVESYGARAVSTLAEERYVQAIVDSPLIDRAEALSWRDQPGEARKRTPGVAERRQIAADLLMVKSDAGWLVPYRDVAAVDGRPVKDRDARAMQLFTSGGQPSPATLRQITEEGARYNLGNVRRTVNVPTMALFVLHPRHIARFEFELGGAETIEGVPTTIVRFREKRGPTLIQTGRRDDVFSSGRLWIAEDGSVRQTAFHVEERDSGIRLRVEVNYRDVPSLGLLLPSEMRETYANVPGDRLRSIEGRATYQNFRAYRVSTSEGAAEIR
jgi:VWFA-related protein